MINSTVELYAAVLKAYGKPDWKKPEQVKLYQKALLLWNHAAGMAGYHGKPTN